MKAPLSDEQVDALRRVDSYTLADALGMMQVRLRNEGCSSSQIRCFLRAENPMVGYAVTGRTRSAVTPIIGRNFVERKDWFNYVRSIPGPKMVVLQDDDDSPGGGAFWDEVHARIHLRLGCVGVVTNGAVRDLSKVSQTGLCLYAGSLCAASGYAHITAMGQPVEVGELKISSGDLIHGDAHGILTIPMEGVPALPGAVARASSLREQIVNCVPPKISL